MNDKYKLLENYLIKNGLIGTQDVKYVKEIQRITAKPFYEIIIEKMFINPEKLYNIYDKLFNVKYIDLNNILIDNNTFEIIPYSIISKNKFIPFKIENGILHVVMDDPLNEELIGNIKLMTQLKVQIYITDPNCIKSKLGQFKENIINKDSINDKKFQENSKNDEYYYGIQDAPIVKLLNSIIKQAAKERASDIHIEPYYNKIRIRFRIDGKLLIKQFISYELLIPIMTRIKIMGKMNIAERRLPQDGSFDFQLSDHEIDIRVSIIPTINGEKAVLRLLDKSRFLMHINDLAYNSNNIEVFKKMIDYKHGMILVTGPTGSGKTTTLYAMLEQLNKKSENVVTVENPVEIKIEGLNQIEVNNKSGLTFSTGLRSILRQDPDIIMIGEIRDNETAEIAIRASITGHLVLTTLHTFDTVSAISRLMDMGIEPYKIAASLSGIISQRLVRKLCSNCCKLYKPDISEIKALKLDDTIDYNFKKPCGCVKCNYTGYIGRTAVFEILSIDKIHREMIENGCSIDELRDYSKENGMNLLKDECIQLLINGMTSYEEVINNIYNK